MNRTPKPPTPRERVERLARELNNAPGLKGWKAERHQGGWVAMLRDGKGQAVTYITT